MESPRVKGKNINLLQSISVTSPFNGTRGHAAHCITLGACPTIRRRTRRILSREFFQAIIFISEEYSRKFRSRNFQVEDSKKRINTPKYGIRCNKIDTKFKNPYFHYRAYKKSNT